MRNKFKYIAVCLFAILMLIACEDKKNKTTVYPEALVTSLSFAKNDSFPGLAEASFTIITASDTGLIYNHDSLRFGTQLDSVIPHFTFNHTPSYAILYSDSDTIVYSGADTINMSVRPLKLYVMASDGKHDKWYDIRVDVHQVNPDLYVWERLNSGVFAADGAESKAFCVNGTFYLFVNNGFRTVLYTSPDATTWAAPQEVPDLPVGCAVRQIIEADGTFYYADAKQILTSADGLSWTADDYSSASFSLVSMLYAFNDSIWAIAQRTDEQLQLVRMAAGGKMEPTAEVLPANFPVSDFATLTFASAAKRARTMIVGGYDKDGKALNTRWNIEFTPNRGYAMTDFSIEQPGYKPLTGVSLIWYDHAIHLFGCMLEDGTIPADNQLVSYDEGMNWVVPDSAKNMLPSEYPARQKASVITTPDHYIYIFGGQNRTDIFSDVWRGRLNRTQFPDYED